MTNAEAMAINDLLDRIFEVNHRWDGEKPLHDVKIRASGKYLAERAYKQLMAGVTPEDIESAKFRKV